MKLHYLAGAVLAGCLPALAQAGMAMTPAALPEDTPAAIPVVDTPAAQAALKNARSTDARASLPATLDQSGLATLHMLGSAEFTPLAFARWRHGIRGSVTVFDLRQEAHGFINGAAVTWYAMRDWGQAGRSHAAAVENEAMLLAAVRRRPEVTLWNAQAAKAGTPQSATPVKVVSARTEASVVQAAHASYVRLTVTDHLRPDDAEVDRFITAVRALPAGSTVLFHCRAGQGRTTTFMVLYDMLRNAASVPAETIIARQAALAPRHYDVDHLPDAASWKYPYVRERSAFIHAFYQYAAANPNGRPLLWQAWLQQQTGTAPVIR